MVNTAHHVKLSASLAIASLLAGALVVCGPQAYGQSAAAFATMPYSPAVIAPEVSAPPVSAKPVDSARASNALSAAYRGPPPVVMFRGTPPAMPSVEMVESPPAQYERPATPRPYSIINQAQLDAQSTGWDRTSLEPVIAPPMVTDDVASPSIGLSAGAQQRGTRRNRHAISRILRDTGRGIVYDVPEALADALPWVDRGAKNEPFEDVLGRVADDLQRASRGDPAWALPAHREIRALSQRLELLPAPPPLTADTVEGSPSAIIVGTEDRPFRPRPIWPGASGRPEQQVRPVTLITTTGQQDGPQAPGVVARYIPATEDDDGNPAPAATPAPKRRAGAGRAASPRRGVRSR